MTSSPLRCTILQVSSSQITVPALDTIATLTLQNASKTPVVLVKPQLSFLLQPDKGTMRDVSRQIYCEPEENNPWFVPSGGTAQLKFKVQFLHDTPTGTLHLRPYIQYFSQSDNTFPPLIDYGKVGKSWQVENPTALFNARAAFVKSEAGTSGEIVPPGSQGAVLLSVNDNRLKGRITLQSPKGSLRPNTDYVAGVLYKSDRSGWDSPINKGAAITEFDANGAVRAHPLHLFEVPYWNWELARFKSNRKTSQVAMTVWNRGWALKQKGQSWYGAAFLVPANKLRVLKTAIQEPMVAVVPAHTPTITFLGDDRPEAGEGGDWIGRYGNESFILCGMQAPQDVVGGRLLPKRRWAKGKDGLAPTALAWTEGKGDFFYEVLTGDPNELPRHWIPRDELTTKDPRGLVNPLEGGRRYAAWDDRGEVHPFDGKGPDLIVNLEIPQGLHRLTLYFVDWDFYNTDRPRAHRLFFSDGTKEEKAGVLSSGYVSDFGQGVYKVYGVSGPGKLRLRIQKDKSVCAVLSGIFLDAIHLPDSRQVLAEIEKPSPLLQQALQDYEVLRQLQKTPEQFLGSSERMKAILRLANQVADGNVAEEKAAANWLRWQSARSLVVAPWVQEPAFRDYLTAQAPQTVEQMKSRFSQLLANDRQAEAKRLVPVWLKLAGQEDQRLGGLSKGLPLSQRETLWNLIEIFAHRDPAFAEALSERWVRLLHSEKETPDLALQRTAQLATAAAQEANGALRTRLLFRTMVTLYNAIEEAYGQQGLGEEGAFRRAEAIAVTPSYLRSTPKKALVAYQDYLQQWPQGRHSQEAQLHLVALGCTLGRLAEPQARTYIAMSADMTRQLLAQADRAQTTAKQSATQQQAVMPQTIKANVVEKAIVPRQSHTAAFLSPQTAALGAAWQMAMHSIDIKDVAAANLWLTEITKRAPETEIGRRAATLIKKG